MQKVVFNDRLYKSETRGDKVYLTDVSDNKIKVYISYSNNEGDNKQADDALTNFWTRELLK